MGLFLKCILLMFIYISVAHASENTNGGWSGNGGGSKPDHELRVRAGTVVDAQSNPNTESRKVYIRWMPGTDVLPACPPPPPPPSPPPPPPPSPPPPDTTHPSALLTLEDGSRGTATGPAQWVEPTLVFVLEFNEDDPYDTLKDTAVPELVYGLQSDMIRVSTESVVGTAP